MSDFGRDEISKSVSVGLLALGTAAVVGGGWLDGYLQDVVLQVGSALLLIAPIVWLERALFRRVTRAERTILEVEDTVVEAVREQGPSGDDSFDTAVLRMLTSQVESRGWEVTEDAGGYLVRDAQYGSVLVSVVRGPLPASRQSIEAAERLAVGDAPVLVVAEVGFTKAALATTRSRTWSPADAAQLLDLPGIVSETLRRRAR